MSNFLAAVKATHKPPMPHQQAAWNLAVLADSLKSLAVGAPAAPGSRISPEPALMRALRAMLI